MTETENDIKSLYLVFFCTWVFLFHKRLSPLNRDVEEVEFVLFSRLLVDIITWKYTSNLGDENQLQIPLLCKQNHKRRVGITVRSILAATNSIH